MQIFQKAASLQFSGLKPARTVQFGCGDNGCCKKDDAGDSFQKKAPEDVSKPVLRKPEQKPQPDKAAGGCGCGKEGCSCGDSCGK